MSKGRTHMSLLSNQQGRPASVRARPPSRSPKGSHSLARPFWLPAAIQASGRRRVACSRCEALWCLGRRAPKEKAAAACATLPGKAVGYSCELSDPSSVRECRGARILSDMRPQVFQECNEIGCDTGHQHPATRGDLK